MTILVLTQVIISWLYSHLLEYLLIRFVFSRYAEKPSTLRLHNRLCKVNLMENSAMIGADSSHMRTEMKVVSFITLLHLPVAFIFPVSFVTLFVCAISYLLHHRACHSDFKTAREYYPWHYDHHMSYKRNYNYCVRSPMMDILFKTRDIYKGTKHEKRQFGKKLFRKRRIAQLVRAFRIVTFQKKSRAKDGMRNETEKE